MSETKLGKKHSEETKIKIRESSKGNKARLGHKTSEETKIKISAAMKGSKKPVGAGKPSVQIEVLDLYTGIQTVYPSIHEAARALDIRQSAISKHILRNTKKPYQGRYKFSKV